MSSIVDFSLLPSNILQKIPPSIRINISGEIDINTLPVSVISILLPYIKNEKTKPEIYDSTLDFSSELSIYNDFTNIESIKNLLLLYLKKFILTTKGSYPFDPTEGSILKYQIHGKDEYLREQLINEEFDNISLLLSSEFGFPIKIINRNISKTTDGISTEYTLDIEIDIKNNDKETINISFNDIY